VQSWSSPTVPRLADLGFGVAPPPRVHDTATGRLHAVEGRDGVVRMYVCGITPYDATHLGHAATYLLFDTINRACIDAGLDVRYVQNVTDIDDPLLERAVQTGDDWRAIADRETALFREDMAALRVIPPAEYIGAVEAMPDILDVVRRLRERGAAYDLDGDVYFSVAAAPAFGAIGHYSSADMLRLSAERGGDPDRPGKKDPLDCLLWQAAKPGEPSWDSPLGAGRPGWHVECAAIALRHLGEQIDVNGGGSDLVFPHHEMSAAQAEVVTGTPAFAGAYVHQAMVGYDGEKMSKSRGNLVFVSRLRAAGVDPMALRIALFAHRHDTDWEWHDGELDGAVERLARWRAAVRRPSAPPAAPLVTELRAALGDGVDTPRALDVVDKWVEADGDDEGAPAAVAAAIDALLGIG
jgi:L-cysteine:1D-myo-inositol 2-amino-2-deoxy-alpha-D-glucopyranoside ligase